VSAPAARSVPLSEQLAALPAASGPESTCARLRLLVRRPEGVQQAVRYVEEVHRLLQDAPAPVRPLDRIGWLGVVEQIWTARSRVQAAFALGEPVLVFEASADATGALALALRLEGLDLPGSPALRRGAGAAFDSLCARLLVAS